MTDLTGEGDFNLFILFIFIFIYFYLFLFLFIFIYFYLFLFIFIYFYLFLFIFVYFYLFLIYSFLFIYLNYKGAQVFNFKDEEVIKKIKDGSFWNLLKYFESEKFLMGCSLSGAGEKDNGRGILSGHAYAILK